MLDNARNQPPKFSTDNWVEINDDLNGTYNTNSQIKFEAQMLKWNMCDYSDASILVKGNIATTGGPENTANANKWWYERNKEVMIKNCEPFTDCITGINNAQKGNRKDLDVVLPMYNLIEHGNNYWKTCGSLWKYLRDEPIDNI